MVEDEWRTGLGEVAAGLYPSHGLWIAESCVKERLDLLKVVCCAEHGEASLADDNHVCFKLSVANNTAELLGDFVQLLQLFAEGVRFFFDGTSEHVE